MFKTDDDLIDFEPAPINTRNNLNTCKLNEFLSLPFHSLWISFLRLSNETFPIDNNELNQNSKKNCPKILRFIFTIAFKNTSTWKDRIEVITSCRKIASNYQNELNTTIWEENAMFIDQILSLKMSLIQVIKL